MSLVKIAALALLLIGIAGNANAQTNPGFISGNALCAENANCATPSNPTSLNGAFQSKADYPYTGPVAGVQFSGTPSAGQVLTATSPGAASWAFPASPSIATNLTNGISRPDGSTITINGSGVLTVVGGGASPANPTATAGATAINGSASTFMRSDAAPAVQTATNSVLGIVKPDGTTITIDDGVLSAMASGGDNVCDPVSPMTCANVKPASTSPGATDNALTVTLSPNCPVCATPGQALSASSFPTVIASDQSPVAMKLNTSPSLANGNGVVLTQGGNATSTTNGIYANLLQNNAVLASNNALPVSLTAPVDPCTNPASTFTTAGFSFTSSNSQIAAGSSGKKIYICHVSYNTSAAASVSLIEGTGSNTCTGGSTAAVYGNSGTTASNGQAFAANEGIALGSGGATIVQTNNVTNNMCIIFSTTNSPIVAGGIKYVVQ